MEVLFFGLVNLVMLGAFLGVSALPAVIAYQVGHRFKVRGIRWVLPVLVIGLPIAWSLAGYSTFKEGCSLLPTQEFNSAPLTPQEGIFSNARSVNGADLIERGIFKFVEQQQGTGVRRDFAGERQHPNSPIPVRIEFVPVDSTKSEYVLTESMKRQSDRWWNPPIHVHTLQVNDLKTGTLVAKKTDLVFGGGLVAPYMRLLGGDQDFEYISCGYASQDVGAWRPSLVTRPRFTQYQEADAAFLRRALNLVR